MTTVGLDEFISIGHVFPTFSPPSNTISDNYGVYGQGFVESERNFRLRYSFYQGQYHVHSYSAGWSEGHQNRLAECRVPDLQAHQILLANLMIQND